MSLRNLSLVLLLLHAGSVACVAPDERPGRRGGGSGTTSDGGGEDGGDEVDGGDDLDGGTDGGDGANGGEDPGESCDEGCVRPRGCEVGPGACDLETNRCVYQKRLAGYVCRPKAGACDVEEICDGASPGCPKDAFLGAGEVCRPKAGPCDLAAETCTGISAACPADSCATMQVTCTNACGQPSVAKCQNGCNTACEGPVELCDDEDNDCDGEVDEGCAPDLVIDNGEEVVLHGEHTFDRVVVRHGTLKVTPYDGAPCTSGTGTPGTGTLVLHARLFEVEEKGVVHADGAGGGGLGCAQSSDGTSTDSGPGGGYGGEGGRGALGDLALGAAYGTAAGTSIEMGSHGGSPKSLTTGTACPAGSTAGGKGGGLLRVECAEARLGGILSADGLPGANGKSGVGNNHDGGGGGSGGGILVRCGTIQRGGTLRARGGKGGNAYSDPLFACQGYGGGGGGGGRIKLIATTMTGSAVIQVTGGAKGSSYLSGSPEAGKDGTKSP